MNELGLRGDIEEPGVRQHHDGKGGAIRQRQAFGASKRMVGAHDGAEGRLQAGGDLVLAIALVDEDQRVSGRGSAAPPGVATATSGERSARVRRRWLITSAASVTT